MAGAPKVFGIGFQRTGTTSLRSALRSLGYTHLDFNRRRARLWVEGRLDEVIAETEGYDSFDDWPWPLMVPELHAHFGEGARFILTRRSSPHLWLASVLYHAMRKGGNAGFLRKQIYGKASPENAETLYLARYKRHLFETRAYFAHPDRQHLYMELCWDEGDGWQKLCAFLGKPVPDLPLPHKNHGRAAREEKMMQLVKKHYPALAATLAEEAAGRGGDTSS
ncbi:sulfotransferase family protein [Paracoccaceae bacterium GXU_MW_L88]